MSQSTPKYYLLQRAEQPVAGITFDPWDVIGAVLWGIYATDNPEEIQALDKAIPESKGLLSEVSAQEYSSMAQKKTPRYKDSNPFRPHPVVTQPKERVPASPVRVESPVKGSGAVVDNNPSPMPEPEAPVSVEPVANIEETLLTGPVDASPTNPARPSRSTGKPK